MRVKTKVKSKVKTQKKLTKKQKAAVSEKLRATSKATQRSQQDSKMATPVGKGRIAESVKSVRKDTGTPELGTRTSTARALLRPNKGKPTAPKKDSRLAAFDSKIAAAESAIKKNKEKATGPTKDRRSLIKLVAERKKLKEAMAETKGLEAPRKELQALRMKEKDLQEALKKATTAAQTAKIKKQIEAIQRKMDARGNMGKQGGKRYGKKVVSLKGGKVDVSKIKKRMAKGGKV